MKKIIRSFTFWLLIIAILELIMHQIGQDSKNIVLIGLNPILHMISNSEGVIYDFMQSGLSISCDTIVGHISIYWYIGSVLTFIVYGIILDGIRCFIHYQRKRKNIL
ncbi:MAG: hypothetical protein RSA18_03945 [Bacilli bacterium]